ncbi:hypothetical protein [Priestia aryabhattai]|uniref:hypothetical protein n=1 Tax=Priestia aryabhattai TaxID=412384 RepID=UPI00203BEF60|nr:hypothetical protein [Priestia aryabhattai]MCM3255586.1 hypothetical protein [Priestia aryabhattai]
MGKVRDWIMNHAVAKEINNLLEEKKADFKPLDYYSNIIEKIETSEFNDIFKDFTKKHSAKAHNNQLGKLSIMKNHLENERFRTINDLYVETRLSQWDNSSCFIYYFTIEKTFDTEDKDFTVHKENFLKDKKGVPVSDIQYKSRSAGGSLETYERLVYIGITTKVLSRFNNGHKAFTEFYGSRSRFKGATMYLYISEITLDETISFTDMAGAERNLTSVIETPLDVIAPYKLTVNILHYLENIFLAYFDKPEFNGKSYDHGGSKNDPWNQIYLLQSIRIKSYNDSIFFNKQTYLDNNKIVEIIKEMPQKQKDLYLEKYFGK